jgi:trimeric autotransporter adhesin
VFLRNIFSAFLLVIFVSVGSYCQLQNAGGDSKQLTVANDTTTYYGSHAGTHTIGAPNSFFGASAGANNTTGSSNSFFGTFAGMNTDTGISNSFFGEYTGTSNVSGSFNSFFGDAAGNANLVDGNSFFGFGAGYNNTTGESNAFFGKVAGSANDTGSNNSFFGANAGHLNSTGDSNAFFGALAGSANDIGSGNAFFGQQSGAFNRSGAYNIFMGAQSGWSNTVENFNTFIGYGANGVAGISNATAIGNLSQVTQSDSLILGGINGVNGATVDTYIGIGTTSPDRQLVVEGEQAIGRFRRYYGTEDHPSPIYAPALLMERAKGTRDAPLDITEGDYLGKVQFRGMVNGEMLEYGMFAFVANDAERNGRFSFIDRDMVTERMSILNTGEVGIGTTNPTESLEVVGNIKLSGGIYYNPAIVAPDYVFDKDYKLMPVEELEKYLAAEKHLPKIPSAQEIKEKGLEMSRFQMSLLEKVEELTLYVVQQKKAIDAKDAEISAMKSVLETRIAALEQQLNSGEK